mmetsp:Transcript_100210/g.323296  ORF Transcript_100210/g.323296 Transcript_100210/m.323296 type:complete len:256 (-) Transcript_100210:220-987(-)
MRPQGAFRNNVLHDAPGLGLRLEAPVVHADEVQVVVSVVEVRWHGVADAPEVLGALQHALTGVGGPALREQDDLVHELVDAAPRLVDAADDGVPRLRQLLERQHDVLGLEAVQAGGGLVHEDELRLVHQLQAEVDPLPLAARDATLPRLVAAHERLPHWRQAEQADDFVRAACPLLRAHLRQAELGRHAQRLLHGAQGEERIVLLHVGAHAGQVHAGRVEGRALGLQQHRPRERGARQGGGAAGQRVQEAALAAA